MVMLVGQVRRKRYMETRIWESLDQQLFIIKVLWGMGTSDPSMTSRTIRKKQMVISMGCCMMMTNHR